MQEISQTKPVDMKIGVIGAGSWGAALANLLAVKGYGIDLWVFEKEVCAIDSTARPTRLGSYPLRSSSGIINQS